MRLLAIAVVSILPAYAWSPAPSPKYDFGYLGFVNGHVHWPAPELLVHDLRSQDEVVRLNALMLIGIPEEAARRYSEHPPHVVKPEQIELRFAALGVDETEQAIVFVQYGGANGIAAVASPRTNGWERIAAFTCWCKYDTDDMADSFVSLVRAPDAAPGPNRFELVLRASGGGTGRYIQHEAHFRFRRGEMKPVMSFVRRDTVFNTGPQLTVSRRSFYIKPLMFPDGSGGNGGVLTEADGESASRPPSNVMSERGFEDRYLSRFTCRTFRWDGGRFEYVAVSVATVCK